MTKIQNYLGLVSLQTDNHPVLRSSVNLQQHRKGREKINNLKIQLNQVKQKAKHNSNRREMRKWGRERGGEEEERRPSHTSCSFSLLRSYKQRFDVL